MYSTIKFIVFLLLAAGMGSFCFAQQADSITIKDTTKSIDSVSITDTISIKKVDKDSLARADSLALMQSKFEHFQYGDVISIANKLLLGKAPFTRKDLLDIYTQKGISHYSLSEDDAAKKSFIEILRIDSSYTLDSTKVSPKIIAFFKQVKNDYISQEAEIESRTVVRFDTIYVPKVKYDYEHENRLKNALFRSIIIPGLGQIYKEEYFKGVVLTVLSSASLIASIYYIADTNVKEKAYLVETNTGLIGSKYDDYNSAYKKRNISMISFGVLWIYSQIDLLFLSEDIKGGNNIIQNSSLNYDQLKGLTLNISYPF